MQDLKGAAAKIALGNKIYSMWLIVFAIMFLMVHYTCNLNTYRHIPSYILMAHHTHRKKYIIAVKKYIFISSMFISFVRVCFIYYFFMQLLHCDFLDFNIVRNYVVFFFLFCFVFSRFCCIMVKRILAIIKCNFV